MGCARETCHTCPTATQLSLSPILPPPSREPELVRVGLPGVGRVWLVDYLDVEALVRLTDKVGGVAPTLEPQNSVTDLWICLDLYTQGPGT